VAWQISFEHTSAPAILFSPDSMGLSDWTVGPSLYSPPRGMVVGWFVVLADSESRLWGQIERLGSGIVF